MSETNSDALLVELFLSNGRVQGITHEVHERRRLVDVLSDDRPAFRLEQAKVAIGSSASSREFPVLNIEKRAILGAIPRETQSQNRQRAMLTSTVGRMQTKQLRATLLLPPFIAEGDVHVPLSVGSIGSKLTADTQIFARFFSMTNAVLTLPGGAEVQTPVLLVNRDLIAGISAEDERRGLASAS